MFCSKFVYEIFMSAMEIEIGKLETFRQLHQRLPEVSLVFWRFWYFGLIPWSRVTITPASQMESELLYTVYETA